MALHSAKPIDGPLLRRLDLIRTDRAKIENCCGNLLPAPGLAVIRRDPDFAGGRYDPAVLRIGKLKAGDVSSERSAG